MDAINTALRNLGHIGGHPGDQYAPRPSEYAASAVICKELEIWASTLDLSDVEYPTYYLTGARGVGKTTELQQIEACLADLPIGKFLPILLRASSYWNLARFDFAEVPFGFTLALLDKLADLGIEYVLPEALIDKIISHVTRTADVSEEKLSEWRVLPSKIAVLGSLLKFVGLDYQYARRTVGKEREQTRKLAVDLVGHFNTLVSELQQACGKVPVFLVDDAEKAHSQSWDALLQNCGRELAELSGVTIWGFSPCLSQLPSYRVTRDEYNFREVFLESIPFVDRSGNVIESNRTFYNTLVFQRIDHSVLPERLYEEIASFANGNLREVLRLIADCLYDSLGDGEVASRITEQAVRHIKAKSAHQHFRQLTREDTKRLVEIHASGQLIESTDAKYFELGQLNYFRQGSSSWFSVHPAIRQSEAFRQALDECTHTSGHSGA